ncbi:MAG: rod shape-determining protein MreC [candidate division Zixibacteria bacterium]|nr:rod shape-determining protein MreC [candidate division Zixibacteria bacterium]MDH3936823.1 rod shape-determining protein MreC [candidate division Zixibacteria bacterium]MDH4035575.1 rod shape-determining protein MreC [candidate division Zixibacteria bacterium]
MLNRRSGLSYKSWRAVNLGVILSLVIILVVGLPGFNKLICQAVLDATHLPFQKVSSTVLDLDGVNEQNRLLRDSLASARLQVGALSEAGRENVRLRSVLGFEPPPGYRLLPARVVSVTGGQLPISAAINKGYIDSVLINQPVINQVGLVGRVQQVMPGYAKIQCLTDPLNRVAGRVATSREMGIVRYLPTEGMVLSNFPNQGAIAVGDTILSSGFGGIYPPGLKVGVVTSVERPQNMPYSMVTLEPVVNFRTIEELFILLPENP